MFPLHSRRDALKAASSGFGYLAFAGLSTWAAENAGGPLAPKSPHLPARAATASPTAPRPRPTPRW